MKNNPDIGHITEGDDNLFADLGFASEEATRFQAESDARIAARKAIKDDDTKQRQSFVAKPMPT